MKQSSAPLAIALIMVVLIVPGMYVLSLGPVIALNDRGIINVQPNSPIDTFYKPLEYATDFEPLGKLIRFYVSLWRYEKPPR